MKQNRSIPCYAPDGTSLGYRTLEAAERLVADGHVNPVYGRKGHLKAIFLPREDGSNPVETHPRTASRYSFLENLRSGRRCWKFRRLDQSDADGVPVRGSILRQEVTGCLMS